MWDFIDLTIFLRSKGIVMARELNGEWQWQYDIEYGYTYNGM